MSEIKETTVETPTIELNQPEVRPEVKGPSREELKENGWSASELEAAEKRGMIPKKKEEEEEPKKEPEITGNPGGTDTAEKPEVEPKKDYSHSQHLKDMDLSPEQEAELRRMFPMANGKQHPVEAMYRMGKNERLARQNERLARQAAEAKAKELEMRLASIENRKQVQQEVDENGNEIDPEDKPLTLKQLREMQKKEAEEIQAQQSQMNERAQRVNAATRDQEEFVRAEFPDFDEKINKAKDLMQNLESLLPERWKQTKAIKLIRDLQVAAANADQMGIDEYTAAHIAYELGSLHPESGKAEAEPNNDGKQSADPKKANGSLTPEQMKRIENNTQRRASSASIPGGGGKRVVSVDDVDLSEVNRMTYQERTKFKEKYPEQYAKLLRG